MTAKASLMSAKFPRLLCRKPHCMSDRTQLVSARELTDGLHIIVRCNACGVVV